MHFWLNNEDEHVSQEVSRLVQARLDTSWQPTSDVVLSDPGQSIEADPDGGLPFIDVDPIELRIMRALAATHPKGQFAVAKTGAIFTAMTKGFSRERDRIYLTGLSPLIDAIGAFVYEFREETDIGIGGRFFEIDGWILDARTDARILELRANIL